MRLSFKFRLGVFTCLCLCLCFRFDLDLHPLHSSTHTQERQDFFALDIVAHRKNIDHSTDLSTAFEIFISNSTQHQVHLAHSKKLQISTEFGINNRINQDLVLSKSTKPAVGLVHDTNLNVNVVDDTSKHPPHLIAYANKHRAARVYFKKHGKPRPGDRIFIHTPPTTGMADRLTGLIAHYALAIVADATFLVCWPEFEKYYHFQDDFAIGAELLPDIPLFDDFNEPGFPKNNQHNVALLERLNSTPVTVGSTSRGFLTTLWNYVPAEFTKTGFDIKGRLKGRIQFKDSFRVLFESLCSPSVQITEVLRQANPSLFQRIVSPDTDFIKVMLQIRLGDGHITKGSSLKQADERARKESRVIDATVTCYIDCAMAYINGLPTTSKTKTETTKFVWFVMTDSEEVKRSALTALGVSSVFVNTLGKAVIAKHYNQTNHPFDPQLHVLAELWLGTHCDIHVVTKSSGLGRISAFQSPSNTGKLMYGQQSLAASIAADVNMFNSTLFPDDCGRCPVLTFQSVGRDWSHI